MGNQETLWFKKSDNKNKGNKMIKFLWILTMIGSVLGCLIVIFGVSGAYGAPQEAAAAAIGIAFAVIPYCLARAVSEKNYLTKKNVE